MGADANWLTDPSGAHQLRYWDGSAWTEHVSDAGVQGVDPVAAEWPAPGSPPPPPAPPAPPAAEPAAGGKLSWKDRLKQAADQGKALAEQAKGAVAEQQSKRTEQWANDPSTVWSGESKNPTGISKARYRITKDRVWIDSGLLGTRSESVPLWTVKDMDVRQAVWQRSKDIGDVVLRLDDASYAADQGGAFSMTGMSEPGARSTGEVLLDNIEGPYAVVELLSPLISEARHKKTMERQSQYLHVNPGMAAAGAAMGAPAPAAAPPAAQEPDLADKLRKLAALRDEGILSDEEFAAQKAKLLGA